MLLLILVVDKCIIFFQRDTAWVVQRGGEGDSLCNFRWAKNHGKSMVHVRLERSDKRPCKQRLIFQDAMHGLRVIVLSTFGQVGACHVGSKAVLLSIFLSRP